MRTMHAKRKTRGRGWLIMWGIFCKWGSVTLIGSLVRNYICKRDVRGEGYASSIVLWRSNLLNV